MWCLVNLPNGTTFGVQMDHPKAIGQECLEKVSFFVFFLTVDVFFFGYKARYSCILAT